MGISGEEEAGVPAPEKSVTLAEVGKESEGVSRFQCGDSGAEAAV
jgi:hypothetical protein